MPQGIVLQLLNVVSLIRPNTILYTAIFVLFNFSLCFISRTPVCIHFIVFLLQDSCVREFHVMLVCAVYNGVQMSSISFYREKGSNTILIVYYLSID